MTSLFVTGITGFVGRAVAARIHEAGHPCRALIRGEHPGRRVPRVAPTAHAVGGDLEHLDRVLPALRGVDAVIHLAAIVDPAQLGEAARVVRTNLDATLALARGARDAGVRRFVFASSIAAMGFWSGRATPQASCRPVSAYGRLKLEAERALFALEQPGFDVVVLRAPTVYGPGERYNFLAWTRAVERGVFRVIGHGENRFPLCSSDNFARAAVAAAEGRVPRGIHLVGDGETYAVNRIHRAIASALGRHAPDLHVPARLAVVVGMANEAIAARISTVPRLLSRDRIRTLTADQHWDVSSLRECNVVLAVDLEAGVARTVAEYRARGLVGALTGASSRQ